jgi:hypothetical protein
MAVEALPAQRHEFSPHTEVAGWRRCRWKARARGELPPINVSKGPQLLGLNADQRLHVLLVHDPQDQAAPGLLEHVDRRRVADEVPHDDGVVRLAPTQGDDQDIAAPS